MSRSSDIVFQIQHRRAERKKPKINAQLKSVRIDDSQKGGIAAAQEIKPPPMTVQKTGGRNSVALTFSIGLHVALALILGVLYIKDQISSTSHELVAVFVPPDLPHRERPTTRINKRPKFETKQQEIETPIQRPTVTNANLPRRNDDFTLPTSTNADLGAVGATLKGAPKVTGFGPSIKGPVQPTTTVVTPSIDRPPQAAPSADLSGPPSTTDGPTLSVTDIDTTQPGSSNPKPTYAPDPKYPANAKRAEKEGTVTLQATIGKDGKPKNVVAKTKLGFGLEEAAIAALKRWKFIPAKKKGEDVEAIVSIKIQFKLDDE